MHPAVCIKGTARPHSLSESFVIGSFLINVFSNIDRPPGYTNAVFISMQSFCDLIAYTIFMGWSGIMASNFSHLIIELPINII